MSRKTKNPKPNPFDLTQPLNPDFFYRRNSPIAKGVIGLGNTQIDDKVRSGELPPLVRAFESGRAAGWLGSQLIELQRRRLEASRKPVTTAADSSTA
jgi:hypothetical protein